MIEKGAGVNVTDALGATMLSNYRRDKEMIRPSRLFVVLATLAFVSIHPKRGAFAAIVLLLLPVAGTAFDMQNERARLLADVIECDLNLRWGGVGITSSGDVVALGRDSKSGQPLLQQWSFQTRKLLAEDRLSQERLPDSLRRWQWDISGHDGNGNAVCRAGDGQGAVGSRH